MFHSQANVILRVAIFPVLLLFWQYTFGTDLPILGPAMCATFLTVSQDPPPVLMVLIMAVVLFVTAWVQSMFSSLFADYSIIYYFFLFVVFYWCMVRTREDPSDLLSILLIISTVMIAVFTKESGADVGSVPYALLVNLLYGGCTAYVAYFILPGGESIAPPVKELTDNILKQGVVHLLFKSTVILITLICSIHLELEQSSIIVIVVALMIKDPNTTMGGDSGIRRSMVTFAGFLYSAPVLLVNYLQVNLFANIAVTLICSLLMAISAVNNKASFNSLQLLYAGFIVLSYYGITGGDSSFNQYMVRLFSIFSSVMIGIMVLLLLQPKQGVGKV